MPKLSLTIRRQPARTTLLVALALWHATARADDITLIPDSSIQQPGGRISGRIESESPTTVRIVPTSGQAREIPVDQIAQINYSGAPASLSLAETRQKSGLLTEAIDFYTQAAGEASRNPLIAERSQFGRAHALAELAAADPTRADEAITALDQFIQANPDSRHLAPALEHLTRISLQEGDLDRAGQTVTKLKQVPWAADRAAVQETRVLAARGENDQALSTLDTLIARASEGSPLAIEARLTRADVLAATGKYTEAEAAVREVIAAAPPEAAELQAEAYNTLGDCLRAAQQPRDALFAYLHTDILYDSSKNQHARALSQIAQLWREQGRADRADEALDRLTQLYPRSPYLKDAQP